MTRQLIDAAKALCKKAGPCPKVMWEHARGSHHGLAATAAHSREAGYIYADCRRRIDHEALQRRGRPYISANDILKNLRIERQVRHDLL